MREAGFDTQLTAGDLPTIVDTTAGATTSYAQAAKRPVSITKSGQLLTKEERQEERFWECRRSLRLWPVPNSGEALNDFLVNKLGLDEEFVIHDIGDITIRRHFEKKPKYKDEIYATFDTKHLRDVVKACGPNLAQWNGEAGMRLHIPDHLQKLFRAFMGLAFDLKKKCPDLRRNVKFDEENLSLYMDIQLREGEEWKRIMPEQALQAARSRIREDQPKSVDMAEIESILSETGAGEDGQE